MLELKPNCEFCDVDLPAGATTAFICTYECTFCKDCVENVLTNVCPNCGGGFTARPIRPKTEYRKGVSLKQQPASTKRVVTGYSQDEISSFVANIQNIKASDR